MRYFAPFLLGTVLMALFACGGNSASTDSSDEPNMTSEESTRSQDQDSLLQLYQQLLAARQDTLPLETIREAGKIYPVDEAPKDTGFFIFREQLLDAVRNKDVFHLMDAIHPDIKVDFGGGSGVADFVDSWKLDNPDEAENSAVWPVLEQVLKNGGTFDPGRRDFTAPYVFAVWPAAYDAFTHVAVTGAGVRLRSAPNLQSQTLTMISNDVVKRLEVTPVEETISGETFPWVKVQLLDETEGYVFGKYIRSSIDYRAGFSQQQDGSWRMTYLVAGD